MTLKTSYLAFVLGSLSLLTSPQSWADEVYTFVVKKQEEKKASRWSLGDWLVTRDRMRIQDLWLAKNMPAAFEFFLWGDYRFIQSDLPLYKDQRDHRLGFSAFAKRVGLSLEKETEPSRLNALFHFRFMGAHNQSTNLTFHAGMRSQQDPVEFRSGILGASLTLYLMNYFGVDLLFRHYFDATANSLGGKFSGNQTEYNLFIDFKFLRIYGGLVQQPFDHGREKGYQIGSKLFF